MARPSRKEIAQKRKAAILLREESRQERAVLCPFDTCSYVLGCTEQCRELQVQAWEQRSRQSATAQATTAGRSAQKRGAMADMLAAVGYSSNAFHDRYPDPQPRAPKPLEETDRIKHFQPGQGGMLAKYLEPQTEAHHKDDLFISHGTFDGRDRLSKLWKLPPGWGVEKGLPKKLDASEWTPAMEAEARKDAEFAIRSSPWRLPNEAWESGYNERKLGSLVAKQRQKDEEKTRSKQLAREAASRVKRSSQEAGGETDSLRPDSTSSSGTDDEDVDWSWSFRSGALTVAVSQPEEEVVPSTTAPQNSGRSSRTRKPTAKSRANSQAEEEAARSSASPTPSSRGSKRRSQPADTTSHSSGEAQATSSGVGPTASRRSPGKRGRTEKPAASQPSKRRKVSPAAPEPLARPSLMVTLCIGRQNAQRFEQAVTEDTRLFPCSCGNPDAYDRWVECCNTTCKIGWFHSTCVGLTETPKAKDLWLCPTCLPSQRTAE